MHREQTDVVFVTEPEQANSQQRIPAQIERPPRFLEANLLHYSDSLALVQRIEIHDRQHHRSCLSNHLTWLAVAADESRAQGFMTPEDLGQCLLHGRDVQWSTKTQASRKIVETSVRLEL